jgi:hypothetical protein
MNVKDFLFDHISRPFCQKSFATATLLIGAVAIILENFAGLGLKTVFGLPIGEALITLSAVFHVIYYIQYGKRSNSYAAVSTSEK